MDLHGCQISINVPHSRENVPLFHMYICICIEREDSLKLRTFRKAARPSICCCSRGFPKLWSWKGRFGMQFRTAAVRNAVIGSAIDSKWCPSKTRSLAITALFLPLKAKGLRLPQPCGNQTRPFCFRNLQPFLFCQTRFLPFSICCGVACLAS